MNNQSFLITQLTSVERDALVPQDGMIIYNLTDNVHQAYENGTWHTVDVDGATSEMTGTDTLQNGEILVNAPTVVSTSRFFLTHRIINGVPGVLYVDPADIIDSTSFKIRSSSGADSSVVCWRFI